MDGFDFFMGFMFILIVSIVLLFHPYNTIDYIEICQDNVCTRYDNVDTIKNFNEVYFEDGTRIKFDTNEIKVYYRKTNYLKECN